MGGGQKFTKNGFLRYQKELFIQLFLKENIRISLRVHCNDFFSKRKHLNYAKINKRGVLIRAGGG